MHPRGHLKRDILKTSISGKDKKKGGGGWEGEWEGRNQGNGGREKPRAKSVIKRRVRFDI